jgi:hypothetical protein
MKTSRTYGSLLERFLLGLRPLSLLSGVLGVVSITGQALHGRSLSYLWPGLVPFVALIASL